MENCFVDSGPTTWYLDSEASLNSNRLAVGHLELLPCPVVPRAPMVPEGTVVVH